MVVLPADSAECAEGACPSGVDTVKLSTSEILLPDTRKAGSGQVAGLGKYAVWSLGVVMSLNRYSILVNRAHRIQVEAARREVGGVGVIDDMS
jgi:hypothetical protein